MPQVAHKVSVIEDIAKKKRERFFSRMSRDSKREYIIIAAIEKWNSVLRGLFIGVLWSKYESAMALIPQMIGERPNIERAIGGNFEGKQAAMNDAAHKRDNIAPNRFELSDIGNATIEYIYSIAVARNASAGASAIGKNSGLSGKLLSTMPLGNMKKDESENKRLKATVT